MSVLREGEITTHVYMHIRFSKRHELVISCQTMLMAYVSGTSDLVALLHSGSVEGKGGRKV